MKKLIALLFILFVANYSFSQDSFLKLSNPVLEDGNNITSGYTFTYGNPVRDAYPLPTIPGADNFFDYVTNGNNMTNCIVIGDTIIVGYFGADSTDPNGANSRVAFYVYSVDGGNVWTAPLGASTLPNRTAYPYVYAVFGAFGRSVAISGRKYSPLGSRGGGFYDPFFGLGGFISKFVPEPGKDYFGADLGGGYIGGIYNTSGTDSLYFIKFHYEDTTFSGQTFVSHPDVNVRWTFNADATGNNLFAMWWNSTTGSEAMQSKTSTDGGTTWSSVNVIQQAFTVNNVINGDTCGPWFGMDATYKPGTSDIYAAWSTLYPTGTGMTAGYQQGCKILVWSPNLNGGVPVEAAGRINMTIISNQTQFENRAFLQVGSTPVSHPSLGFSEDGSALACFFHAFQPGDSLDGFTFNDIYATYSYDDGATWSTPENITNTSDWDEMYPTVAEVGNTHSGNTYTWNVHYQATRGPGSQSFTDNTPVYRVFEVYQKISITSIKVINSNVPDAFSLYQNYPNPFNPTTSIRFDIQKQSEVTLKIYDVMGREVATLINNETVTPGTKEVDFDASSLSSGIYFYTLSTVDFTDTKKMMLLK
jgi:hypothetical protein